MLPDDGRRQRADDITHNHSIIPFLEFLRSGSILEHQLFWKQCREKVTAAFSAHQAVLLAQAWGKQRNPRGHVLQKSSCSRREDKGVPDTTQCNRGTHFPALPPRNIRGPTLHLAHQSAHCKEKTWNWKHSASQKNGRSCSHGSTGPHANSLF